MFEKGVLNGDHDESDKALSWNVLFWIIIFVFGKCALLVFFSLPAWQHEPLLEAYRLQQLADKLVSQRVALGVHDFPGKKEENKILVEKKLWEKEVWGEIVGYLIEFAHVPTEKNWPWPEWQKEDFWESIKGKGKEAYHFPTKRSPSPSSVFTRNCAVLLYSCSGRG